MTACVVLLVGGVVSFVTGAVLYGLAGGVEAGYQGNATLGDFGGTLVLAGVLAFVAGLIGVLATAAWTARAKTSKRRR